jgi:putative flippase GtrA
MRFFEREPVRFVLAGGFNTVVTYVVYLALLSVVNYAVAYTVTYVAGVFFAYYLSARFVFRRPIQWRHAIQYPLVYVLQYVSGMTLTAALVEGLNLNARYAPALVIVLTLPLTFVTARWIVKREKRAAPLDEQGQGRDGRTSSGDSSRRHRTGIRALSPRPSGRPNTRRMPRTE